MKKYAFILLLITSLAQAQHHDDNEIKFSLFYANDQYELTVKHLHLLDSIKQLDHKDELDVHIKGYTNNVGNEKYNLALSKKRAQKVTQMLREFTIVSSTGHGEINSDAAKNRRVDILVHRKEDHVAEEGEVIIAPKPVEPPKPNLANLTNPQKGDKIALNGIMFYADRDVIADESKATLEELVEFLERNPHIRFKLIGHICCGDPMKPAKDMKNLRTGKDDLSQARAKAVHNYLVKKGISSRRMRYIGMAFRQPTGKGDAYDKRVEIEITSADKK